LATFLKVVQVARASVSARRAASAASWATIAADHDGHVDLKHVWSHFSYHPIPAVWTYENPFEAMAQIKDYVAFYPDRVDEIS
jgi:hypothetical protein